MNRRPSALHTTIIVLGSSWFTVLFNVLRVLVLPTKLGDSGMGIITLAISFTTFFGIFTSLGTSTYLIRAIARNPEEASRYLSNAMLLRIAMGIGVLGLMMEVATLLGYSQQTLLVIFIVGISTLIFTLSNVLEAGLQGLGQQSWRAVGVALGQTVTIALGVATLLAGADAVAYAITIPIGMTLQLAIMISYYLLKHPISFNVDTAVMRALLIGGMPLFLWGFLQSAYGQIDATILSLFAGVQVVGWFGASLQITSTLIMVPTAISAVAMPMLCKLYVSDERRFDEVASKITVTTMLLMTPVGVGLALSSRDVLQLLPYPSTFLNAAPVLSLLALSLPVTGTLMILASLAVAIGQERQWVKISAFAVCIFPPLYVSLIWWFQTNLANGAVGAALANFIGETLLLMWAWIVLPARVRQGKVLYRGAQILALSAMMLVVVVGLQQLHMPLPIYVPVGALVYLAGAWLLRLVTPGQVRVVLTSLGRRNRRAEALS
ncbi:MAG: flippase [Chloroflexi bacterium]|nr:flippase [Chloroflexota bacterium]